MSASSKVGVSSLVGLVLSSMAAIGAPPSDFVQEPNVWLRLEPAMFPALLAGVLLALGALAATIVSTRVAAISCVAGAISSMAGVLVAWGIDANAGPRALAIQLAFLAVPLLGAGEAFRQVRQEDTRHHESSMEQRAG